MRGDTNYEGDSVTTNTDSKLAVHIAAWIQRNRKKSWTAMFMEAGLAAGTAIPIRSGKEGYLPSIKTLDKLAEYMGEDRQYLRELAGYATYNGTEEQLTSDERSLVEAYRKLDEATKNMAYDLVQRLGSPD